MAKNEWDVVSVTDADPWSVVSVDDARPTDYAPSKTGMRKSGVFDPRFLAVEDEPRSVLEGKRVGPSSNDLLLNPDYIDSVRDSFASIPDKDKLAALRQVAEYDKTVRGRAAKALLEQAEYNNAKITPEAKKEALELNKAPKVTPTGGKKQKPKEVSFLDSTPNILQSIDGVTAKEVVDANETAMGLGEARDKARIDSLKPIPVKLEESDKSAYQRLLDLTVNTSPGVGGFALESAGDVLRGLSQGVMDFSSSAWGAAWAAANGVGAGNTAVGKFARDAALYGKAKVDSYSNPNDPNSISQNVARSIVGSLASAGLTGGFGNASLALMSGVSAGNAYAEAKAAGRTDGQAAERAAVNFFAEFVGEKVALPALQKLIKSAGTSGATMREIAEMTGEFMARDGIGEQFTTAVESFYDKFGSGGTQPNMTWADYTENALQTFKSTFVQGLVMGGGSAGINRLIKPPTPESVLADTLNNTEFTKDGVQESVDFVNMNAGQRVPETTFGMAALAEERAKLEQLRATTTKTPEQVAAAITSPEIKTVNEAISIANLEVQRVGASAAATAAINQIDTDVATLTQNAPTAPIPGLVDPLAQGSPAPITEPVRTWTGRKGGGYDTADDAATGLARVSKDDPSLDWRVEQMPDGRFRVAGYAQTPVIQTRVTPTPDNTTLMDFVSGQINETAPTDPRLTPLSKRPTVAYTGELGGQDAATPAPRVQNQPDAQNPAGGVGRVGSEFESVVDAGATALSAAEAPTVSDVRDGVRSTQSLKVATGIPGLAYAGGWGVSDPQAGADAGGQREAQLSVKLAAQVAKSAFGVSPVPVKGLGHLGVAYQGKAFVDVDEVIKFAEQEGKNPAAVLAIQTVGHETTHVMEKSADPEDQRAYKNFRAVVLRHAKPGVLELRGKIEGVDAASELAASELTADVSGNFWFDHKFWGDIYDIDNGSTFRRVVYRFMQAATKFIGAAKGFRFNNKALVSNVDEVRKAAAQMWAQKAMGQKPPAEIADQVAQFSQGVEAPAGVIAEVAPNPDQPVANDWREMTIEERTQATRAVANKVVPRVFSELGLKGWTHRVSTGTFEHETNPNVIIDAPKDSTHEEIDEVAKALGHALDQKAMVTFDEGDTNPETANGFVKVVIPAGMSTEQVNSLRNWIADNAPQVDGDTLRDGALIFGNFTHFGDNPLSDDEYRAGIRQAVESFDWNGAEIRISQPERYFSGYIQPETRDGYLEGTRYGEGGGLQTGPGERGDDVRGRQGRGDVERLRQIGQEAIALRDRWIAARASARRGPVATEGASRPEREYGTPRDRAVSAVGVHFSQQRRPVLSSTYFGTGHKGSEQTRLADAKDIAPRIYFYVDNGNGVHPEAGVGGVRHTVKLNNLYSTKLDPLGLVKGMKSTPEGRSDFERSVVKSGFDGYLADNLGGQQDFAVLLGKHEIEMPRLSRSQDVTQTEAFKKWFGNSKVVDADGNPLIAYHGTTLDFSEFKTGDATSGDAVSADLGAWFAAPAMQHFDSRVAVRLARSTADGFAEMQANIDNGNDAIYPVYLSIKNPMEFDGYADLQETLNDVGSAAKLRERAISGGYDGIVVRDSKSDNGQWRDDWVAFEPTQIKSSIGNNGNFDPANPDIRYSVTQDGNWQMDEIDDLTDEPVSFRDQSKRLGDYEKTDYFANGELITGPGLPAFMRDNKLVDDNGNPLVWYHGTARDVESFTPKQADAVFLSPKPEFAESFADASQEWMSLNYRDVLTSEQVEQARDRSIKKIMADKTIPKTRRKELAEQIAWGFPRGEAQDAFMEEIRREMPTGPNIMPLIARATNPFDYRNEQHVIDLIYTLKDRQGKDFVEVTPVGQETFTVSDDDLEMAISSGIWNYIEAPEVQDVIRNELGHDAFYVKEGGVKNLAVYDPKAVKSLIGNNGQYSLEDARINFSKKQDAAKTKRELAREPIPLSTFSSAPYNRLAIKIFDEGAGKSPGVRMVDSVGVFFDARAGGEKDFTVKANRGEAIRQAVSEVLHMLTKEKSGKYWYEEDVRRSFSETEKHIPSLKSERKRRLFSVVAGIMSAGVNAQENWFIAANNFKHYENTGVISGRNPENGKLWHGGTKSVNKAKHLGMLDTMVRDLGESQAVDWLYGLHTVSEINDARLRWGNMGTGISGKADSLALGLKMFGKKIGPFVMNINGIHDVTVDVWMTRTFNRWFGRMIGPDGKMRETPTEPERRVIKSMVESIAVRTELKPYQVQSVLWFFEQGVFRSLGTNAKSYNFSDGARKFAEREAGRGNTGDGAGRQDVRVDDGAEAEGGRQAGINLSRAQDTTDQYLSQRNRGLTTVTPQSTLNADIDLAVRSLESAVEEIKSGNYRQVSVPIGPVPHTLRMLGHPTQMLKADASIIRKVLIDKHSDDFKDIGPREFVMGIYRPALVLKGERAGEFELVTPLTTEDGPVMVSVKADTQNAPDAPKVAAIMSAYAKPVVGKGNTIGSRILAGRMIYADMLTAPVAISGNSEALTKGSTTGGLNSAILPQGPASPKSVPQGSTDGKPLNKNFTGWKTFSTKILSDIANKKIKTDVDLVGWIGKHYKGDAKDAPAFSKPQDVGPIGFYSALHRSVDKLPYSALPAAGWKDAIKSLLNKGQIKSDEVEWTGINEWIGLQSGKVSKQQVLDYLGANGVQVEETVLGDDPGFGHWIPEGSDEEYGPEPANPTKYAQYTLPGGERYREVLLTLPKQSYKYVGLDSLVQPSGDNRKQAFEDAMMQKYGGETFSSVYGKLSGSEVDRYEQIIREARQSESNERNRVASQMARSHPLNNYPSYKSAHWDQPNVLAHIRVNDRTDADGKLVLFVEEIQSDWGQSAKKDGFQQDPSVIQQLKANLAKAEQAKRDAETRVGVVEDLLTKPLFLKGSKEDQKRILDRLSEARDAYFGTAVPNAMAARAALQDAEMQQSRAVPKAPFIDKTDKWLNLALKRVIAMAVEGGYDKIAFVNGEQSAKRYSLRGKIDTLLFDPSDGRIIGRKDGGNIITKTVQNSAEVEDVVGKEVAERLLSSKKNEYGMHEISGLELEVGGTGMMAFYDTIVLNAVKALAKKLGGEVGETTIGQPRESRSDYSIKERATGGYVARIGSEAANFTKWEDANAWLNERFGSKQFSLTITPAMSEKVEDGLPLFSRAQPRQGINYMLPGETRRSKARRILQDYFLPVLEVQNALLSQGGTVTEASDVYRAEERMYGRIEEALRDFRKRWFDPMIQKTLEKGLTMDEVSLYAYAKHAKERNEHIATIRNDMPDNGSGMTSQEADAILKQFEAEGKTANLEDIHGDLMAITAATRRVMVDEGLITQDQYDAWENQYEFYVPLRGFENADPDGEPVPFRSGGRGFNIRGKETMRALGRRTRATDIIENIALDYEKAVDRGERNQVAKSFLEMIRTNPDPSLWEINKRLTKESFDRYQGKVVKRNQIDAGADTIAVKIDGKEVYITIKDQRLLNAMRRASKSETGQLEAFINQTSGRFLSLIRKSLTQYNPVFSAVNAVRDFQTGSVGVLDTLGMKGVGLYAKHYRAAVAAAGRHQSGSLGKSGMFFGDPTMDRYFEEFRAAGGTTGGFYGKSAEDMKGEIRNILLASGAKPKGLSENIRTLGGSKTGRAILRGVQSAGNVLEFTGAVSENAARVAAYRAARELGKTPAEAASIAKNLTTNFNRKGEWGAVLNGLFLFYNASVQGAHRAAVSMKNPKVLGLTAGLAALGATTALLALSMGGDDDDDGQAYWDKIPQFEKERNLIIMLPPGYEMDGVDKVGTNGRYIKIPMPYVYNILPNFGMTVVDVIRNQKDKTQGVSVAKGAVNMLNSVMGSLNPLGGSVDLNSGSSILQAVFPTVADIAVQQVMGVDSFSRPTAPYKGEFDLDPDSENVNARQAGGAWHMIARGLNRISGGDQYEPGWIDVTPGTLENAAKQLTGGTGTFLSDLFVNLPTKLYGVYVANNEADITYRDVPFLRNFYGEVDGVTDSFLMYERRRDVMKAKEVQNNRRDAGVDQKDDPKEDALASLGKMSAKYTKQMSALKKEEISLAEDAEMTTLEKNIRRKEIKARRSEIAREYNRIFMDVMRDAQ